MFLDLDKKNKTSIAIIDDNGTSVSYGEICEVACRFKEAVSHRTLIFILAENNIGALVGYTSCLIDHIVPLIISTRTDRSLFDDLFNRYCPEYIWMPQNAEFNNIGTATDYSEYGYFLVKTSFSTPILHDDLSMLLPTSGSTGSPKLVRHSYVNIEANAENVSQMFKLTNSERPMAVLPIHYTMGLSVISSHLLVGATILLSGYSLMDKKFWQRLKNEHATSFTGVPYSYELLEKLRFFRMELPELKIISQGGGRMTPELFSNCAQYAARYGKNFIATYGQTECTARMAYLPPELAMKKTCSIGIAEPGGLLSIVDDEGRETYEGESTGELVYRGKNVTMGYAVNADDLRKGDENNGVMHTGDMAYRDEDGCYFIVGRLKRFLKIFGLRIGLDEVEHIIKSEFLADCYCSGTDDCLSVRIVNPGKTADEIFVEKVIKLIENKTHLFHRNIKVDVVDRICRNEAGKIIVQ